MLIYLSLYVIAVGFALSGSFTFWRVTSGIDFYKPIVLFIAGFILAACFWWVFGLALGLFVSHKKEYEKPSKFFSFWLREYITISDIAAGVHTKVINGHLLPKDKKFLIVCNHQSNFDPMILVEKFARKNIAFVTKPSNFRIPIGGNLMIGACYTSIDRDDPIQSLGVMKRCAKLIVDDVSSVGVFPEGTRHKDGVLGDFHEGVLSIATYSKAPIVVAVVKNTNQIHKRFPRFTKCTLKIVRVIPYEEYDGKTVKAISDEIHTMMEEELKK